MDIKSLPGGLVALFRRKPAGRRRLN